MNGYLTIELKALRLFGNHGLYAEELKTGNSFEVDVLLEYKAPEKPVESIIETIDYVAAYSLIKKVFAGREDLLETCAMNIAAELHQNFPQIIKVVVSIKKLTAPLTNFTGTLGVTYTGLYK